MKFSWRLINNFISINHIPIQVLEEKLALSGIEIEEIKEIIDTQDKIINASITANRKDIFSAISLANEIGIITNYQLKIKGINNPQQISPYQHREEGNKKPIQFSINEIRNIHLNETPKWIKSCLQVYDIKSSDIVNDIKKYIEIKWGYTFYIFNKDELLSKLGFIYNTDKKNDILVHKHIISHYNINSNFLVFSKYNVQKNKMEMNTKSYSKYYFNSYLDTIKILNTFTKCTIGKVYNVFGLINRKLYQQTIEVDKRTINTTLGRLSYKQFKNTSYSQVLLKLNQLNLTPKYNRISQKFLVKIPNDRQDDLSREIDIIEEIGRIQGYKNFWEPLSQNNIIGKISKASIKLKETRKILRGLGLNEVINSCLAHNKLKSNNIIIYNPLTQEQSTLRTNILDNLINNYFYNSKQNHNSCGIEIFEIGKTFRKASNKDYIEEMHVGGLIYNNTFTRETWRTQPTQFNFFHLKGIIEILLEQLNSKATLNIIKQQHKGNNYLNMPCHLFDEIQNIGIYNKDNQEIIGILGKINTADKEYISERNIYAFELNIDKLKLSIKQNYHLSYQVENYSNYPCVTRDISIQINKTNTIESVQKILSTHRSPLIQSIRIFNEYLDKKSHRRSISLRITYQSIDRTLTSEDITTIDNEISSLLSKFESKT